MAINVTIFPVDGPAVVYYQDGSAQTFAEQEEHSFQIVDNGFCTISDAPEDEDEIPPFVQMMVKFWQKLWSEVKEETQPEVNPL